MLEKNLQAIGSKNPKLAQILKETSFSNIDVFESQTRDINIAYNNIALHSDFDPINEALDIVNKLATKDSKDTFYVLYGLGLGYLFKRLFMSTNAKIIIFEPVIEILRFTLEAVDFAEELKDPRVFVCSELQDAIDILDTKFISGDHIDFLYLPSYLKFAMKPLEKLSAEVINLINTKKVDHNTILNKSVDWVASGVKNIDFISKSLPLECFKDIYSDAPIVIALAGPSLEPNIELLKAHKDKFILVAVNTSMRPLLNNGLIPDFCMVTEYIHIDTQFKGLKNLDKIHYILTSRAFNFVWGLNSDYNTLYLNETDGFSIWYNNKILNNQYTLYKSAGSVAILAFYSAMNIFKSNKIILVGQDLAFVDNQFYSPSVIGNDHNFYLEDGRFKATFDMNKAKNKKGVYLSRLFDIETVEIKNAQNETILTRKDYYGYIKQYEEIMAKEVPEGVEVINTSLKGAYIEGMTYKPLKEILQDIDNSKEVYIDRFYKAYKDNISLIDVQLKRIKPEKAKLIKEIKNYKVLCNNLLITIKEFEKECLKGKGSSKLEKLINTYYSRKTPLSSFISSEELVFFLLQKPLLEYSRDYIVPQANRALTLEDYIKNLQAEKALLESIIKHFNLLLGLFEGKEISFVDGKVEF